MSIIHPPEPGRYVLIKGEDVYMWHDTQTGENLDSLMVYCRATGEDYATKLKGVVKAYCAAEGIPPLSEEKLEQAVIAHCLRVMR